jgi:hypothetical protein
MARDVTTIRSPRAAAAAFDYLADLHHFAEWDPGVRRIGDRAADGLRSALDEQFMAA